MKAIIYTKYGGPDVLQLKEVEKPIPKDKEVLIRIYATALNYGDLLARNVKGVSLRNFTMPIPFYPFIKLYFGIWKPRKRILGSEFSGVVEEIGKKVNLWNKGDKVYGYSAMKMGTNAEYICLPEKGAIAIKPSNMTFLEAACISYGAVTALNLLRKVDIKKGQKVLVNGASGSIGSAAVQLLKHYYCTEVTGVCGTPRLEFVKILGADKVIDYTKEDFTKNGEKYDLIFDILNKSRYSQCKKSLTQNGRYLLASFGTWQLIQMLFTRKKVICAMSFETPEDLIFTKDLCEKGMFKAVIDKSFPLDQTAEAHRYAESGLKKGQIVIDLNHTNLLIIKEEKNE